MKFLTAEWRKLIIINYEINPEILQKYLPQGTELDFYNERCLVSLVGFMFTNTKLLGVAVPFHTRFEEINLRFYVKKREGKAWKRGVVFIKEIVPKHCLIFVANLFYNEHYETLPMKHLWLENNEELSISYSWKKSKWNSISITAENKEREMDNNSEFEFITEHYFGFTQKGNSTTEYEVKHPKWTYYKIKKFELNVDFKENYGEDFSFLNNQLPFSTMLAEGSEVEVLTKKKLIL